MNGLPTRVTEIAEAGKSERPVMTAELRALVRRSAKIAIPASHVAELDRRVAAVLADPSITLSPRSARALLRKRSPMP